MEFEIMAWLDIAKQAATALAAVAACLVPFGRYILSLRSRRQKKFIREFELAQGLFADNKHELMNDLLLEKGYLAFFGRNLTAATIRYFAARPSPLSQLHDYSVGRRFLKDDEDDAGEFRGVRAGKILSTTRRYLAFMLAMTIPYFMFASLSVVPIVFLKPFIDMGLLGLIYGPIFPLAFAPFAYIFLDQLWAAQAARRVLNRLAKQTTSTPRGGGRGAWPPSRLFRRPRRGVRGDFTL